MRSDLQWIQENIFTPTCAISGCHRGPTSAQGVDLSAGVAEDNLVARPSGRFNGETLVIPGDSANSYLMVALGTYTGQLSNVGTMPPGFPILCREKREAIERWITALGNRATAGPADLPLYPLTLLDEAENRLVKQPPGRESARLHDFRLPRRASGDGH